MIQIGRLVLLILATVLSHTAAAESNSVPRSIPELQAAIESVLKDTRTPGAAIAIVSRDRAEWVAGLGTADVAAHRPVTADTLFRLGSISKSFVAVAALQLQEAGKLKLSDTVRQWAPDVTFVNPWEATHPLRLVHLLEQTTGFDDMRLWEYALDDPTPMSLKDALAEDAAPRVCRWPPGTRMSYSSSAPGVLAAVIEKVSGQRFEDYVQEHIFNPLGMDTAGYFPTPEAEKLLARLYHPDGVTPYPYWHIALRPTAAANASAKDMANYLRFYLQRGALNGTQVLSAASVERMETTETMPSAQLGRMMNYGLCNYPMLEGPFVFHGHNGAVPGGMAQMAYLPGQGRGYAVMFNSGSISAELRIGKLVRAYLTNGLAPPALPPVAPVPPGLKEHYQGYYQFISPNAQWCYGFLRLMNVKQLTFSATGLSTSTYGLMRESWVPLSGRLFRRANETMAGVALLPDAGGEKLIQYGTNTFQKISAWEFWAQLIGAGLVSALVLSALALAPIRGIRWLCGRRYPPGARAVRLWPTVSAALLVAFDLLLVYGFRGMVTSKHFDDVSLGTPTLLTVSIMLASLAFPPAAVAALYAAYRARNAPIKRAAYWHSVLVAVAVMAVAVYYGYWGLIGLRLWA